MNWRICIRIPVVTAMGLVGLCAIRSAGAQADGGGASAFPDLASIGDRFTFAICADPQVSHKDNMGSVAANARRTQILATQEINAMESAPAFAVFLGDLVNVFDERSVANFEECIADLQTQPILVHGNHDTQPPYDAFRALMQRVCGIEEVYFSWDAGPWHFIALPCNLAGNNPPQQDAERAMLAWLEADLAANADRPTMVFEHLHAMPQGLTQLEWYTFPLPLRLKLIELLTRHGNVRWYFNGHVHNGLKASVKTSWHYKGINFVTAPTIIQSRNFGEEYPAYERGLEDGGYYLLVHVNGAEVHLEGRLAGEALPFEYPSTFREFREDIEPRWFRRVTEMPGSAQLLNGDFEDGLNGWLQCYRYVSDVNPGFLYENVPAPNRAGMECARLLTRMKEPVSWASDENTEIYQIVNVPVGQSPTLNVDYFLEESPRSGGGYIRLVAMAGADYRFLMMLKWGQNEHKSHVMPRAFGYALHGEQQSWRFLQDLGARRQGLYWTIPSEPGTWHTVSVNAGDLYDEAHGEPGAYSALGVDRVLVALGTWCNNDSGAFSTASFDRVQLTVSEVATESQVDGRRIECDGTEFATVFGQELEDRVTKERSSK